MAAEPEKAKKSGIVPLIAVVGAITAIALGAGWFIGSQIRQTIDTELAANADMAPPARSDASAKMAAVDEEERAAIGTHPGDSKKKKKKDDGHGADKDAASDAHAIAGLFGSGPEAVKLDPIVANLGTPDGQWIRLELAVIYRRGVETATESEKGSINEAIIGMLRSKTPDDLSGPSGFLQFREDLSDAVMLSSGGRALSVKILSMVLE